MFLDVGANIGIYSLFAAACFTEQLSVISLEPVADNFSSLAANIRENPGLNVAALPIALAERSSVATLYVKDGRPGNSGAQLDSAVDERGREFIPVSRETVLATSLDVLVRDFGLAVPRYLKIDIDGLETQILRGAKETLRHQHSGLSWWSSTARTKSRRGCRCSMTPDWSWIPASTPCRPTADGDAKRPEARLET